MNGCAWCSDAAEQLEGRGEKVTKQRLTEELGPAFRFSIADFLSGIREVRARHAL